MTNTVIGADRVRRKLARLKTLVPKHMARANQLSGEELIRIARVLHPGDGATRAEIVGRQSADGSYTCDFGSKAKVTEGKRGPRPFVNPALKATEKKRKRRRSAAVGKAVKEAMNG